MNLELYKQFMHLGMLCAAHHCNKNEDGVDVTNMKYHAAFDAIHAINQDVALECHEVYCDIYRECIRLFGE